MSKEYHIFRQPSWITILCAIAFPAIFFAIVFIYEQKIKEVDIYIGLLIAFGAILMEFVIINLIINNKRKHRISESSRNNLRKITNKIGELYDNKHYVELNKTIDYLSFIINKNILDEQSSKAFNPNDNAINILYNVKCLISFTNAHPIEWLHPTFNFYLLNNYILNLLKNNGCTTKSGFTICHNRDDARFNEYLQNRMNNINNLQSLLFPSLSFTNRFYFLSIEDIKQNSAIISSLVSGHELCGGNLFLLNPSKYKFSSNNKKLSVFMQSSNFDEKSDGNSYVRPTIDFAIAYNLDETLSLLYKDKTGFGIYPLSEADKANINVFIKDLSRCILDNSNTDVLFDVESLMNSGVLQKNNEFCHICFNS